MREKADGAKVLFRLNKPDDQQKTSWVSPPTNLTLGRDEIHVRRASLELPASAVEQLLTGHS